MGSVSKVGTTSVWRTLCPPGVTLGHVLASEARMHTAVCTYVCIAVVCTAVYVYAYVLCTCVCVWPYVCLCSISAVFFTFFGNLFGISTNDPPFHWLF